jgi:hypothetical protein
MFPLPPLRYEELVLKEELEQARPPGAGPLPVKLRDFGFVERMGECGRLPPQPPAASALASIVYRWRLDAEPVGVRLSQANLVASMCATIGNELSHASRSACRE